MRGELRASRKFYNVALMRLNQLLTFSLFLVTFLIIPPTYAANCYVQTAPQLIFGVYDPLSKTPLDMSTTIVINCDSVRQKEHLMMDVGFTSSNNSGATRSLKGPVDSLHYDLFSNPARSILVTDTTNFSFKTNLIGSQSFSLPIYGRIYAKQSVSSGIYQSSIMMTINF